MQDFDKQLKKVFENTQKDPVAEKQCAARIVAGKTFIFKNLPIVGYILKKLRVVMTYDIPTMAVDDIGNIYINPIFGMKITPQEFVGVLIHEAVHVLNLTFLRKKHRRHKLWNIATDYIMNRDIKKDGFALPKGVLEPDENGIIKVKYDDINKGETEVDFDISDKSAEWLYAQLEKLAKNAKPSKDGEGEPSDGKGNKGLDDHIETKKGDSKPNAVEGADQPQELDDVKKEVGKAIQQERMDRMKNVEKNRSASGNGAINNTVVTLMTPKVDWKVILKQLIQKVVGEYTWRKPQKRALAAGYYAPVSNHKPDLKPICLALDTSGSVTVEEINTFFTELRSILGTFNGAEVLVVLWHGVAYHHVLLNKSNINDYQNLVVKNIQIGGTTMSSVADYLKAKNLDANLRAVVYLTDGHVEPAQSVKTLPPPCINIIMVTDPSTVAPLTKVPNSKVFYIEVNNK